MDEQHYFISGGEPTDYKGICGRGTGEFQEGDVLLLQNEINELPYIMEQAYEKGMKIVLNPSPFDDALRLCNMESVSLFLVNEVEGFQMTGEKEPKEIIRKMHEMYPYAEVVLTLGIEKVPYLPEKRRYVSSRSSR